MRRNNFVLRYIILIFELEKKILTLQIILIPPELECKKNTFLDNEFEIPFVTEIEIPSSYILLCI